MATTGISVYDALGNQIAALSAWLNLEYTRGVNTVGNLTLTLDPSTPLTYFKRDGMLAIERAAGSGPPVLDGETRWLMTRMRQVLTARGEYQIQIGAVDGVDLLRRHIVAAAAGSAQATVTNTAADTLARTIVLQQCGSSASATRQYPASLFTVDAVQGVGPTLSKSFARRGVLPVLQEIAAASTTAGTYMAFDVVWNGSQFEFRVYLNQRGVDRRFPSGLNPVLLTVDTGALANVLYETDYTDEVTLAYAGGQGEGTDRVVASSQDTTRSGLSPFAVIESWTDARQTADSTTVQNEADGALRLGRPRVTFSAELVETPGYRWGVDYKFGDIVTALAFNQSVDCRIDAYTVKSENSGHTDRVSATLRSVL